MQQKSVNSLLNYIEFDAFVNMFIGTAYLSSHHLRVFYMRQRHLPKCAIFALLRGDFALKSVFYCRSSSFANSAVALF